MSRMTRVLAVPAAVALGLSLFAVSLTWQVPAVKAASGPLDAQSSEIVRLINGVRQASGKAPLVIDTNLRSKARDGSIPCPDDSAKTIAGRTQDFATSGLPTSHNLRLCDAATPALSGTSFVSTMQTAWGYGSVGEIIGLNGGFGNGAYLYQYIVGGKILWQTWTYSTVGHIMGSATTGWQSSSTHWSIIMGAYDRLGCGGWANPNAYFYDCAFARGGSYATAGAPTNSPFSNPLPPLATNPPPAPVRTAAPPPPATPAQAATESPTATPVPTDSPSPSPSPSPTAVPTPAANMLKIVDSTATASTHRAVALMQGGSDLMPPEAPIPATVARVIALVAGTGAGLLSALLGFVSFRRRRRETAL